MSSTFSLLMRPFCAAAAMSTAGSPVWMWTRISRSSPTTSADSPNLARSSRIASTSRFFPVRRNSVQYPQPSSFGATAAAPRRPCSATPGDCFSSPYGSRTCGSPRRACPAVAGGRSSASLMVRVKPSRITASPKPPASTTPASRRTASWSIVRSTAAWLSWTTRSRTTRRSSLSAAAAVAAVAASRMTVRMVPSVGFITARYATADASVSARATPFASTVVWPVRPCARPRRICDRITPLLPRAPMSDPCAAAAITESIASGVGACCASSTAERSVKYMFEPVSPSGTGNTLRSLISCWFASSQASALSSPASACGPPTSRNGVRSTLKPDGAGSVALTVRLPVYALHIHVDREHGQAQGLLDVIPHRTHQVVRDLADARAVLSDDVELDDDAARLDLDLDPAVHVLAIQALCNAVAQSARGHAHDAVRLTGGVPDDGADNPRRYLDSPERSRAGESVGRLDLAFHVTP